MKTKIWAHRGASGYMPENTLEAFRKAVEMGADGIELDVQLSRDGELVVTHDETVDRVSDGTGNVKDFTLKELKALNFGASCPSGGCMKIPTLAEVLEEMRPSGIEINIECKTGIWFYPGLEEKVAGLVKDMNMTDRVWCSSFHHASALAVRHFCPEIRTGFLVQDVIINAAEYAKSHGADALHPALYHMQDKELIRKCKENALAVHVWTVNEEQEIAAMIHAGVDAIITNYPDRARYVLEHLRSFA